MPFSALPSIILQSINRFIPSRDVVCVHTRVSHAFHSAASQPYSTKVLPADDDHSHFLSSRSTDIWPWKFTGFEKEDEGFVMCNRKLDIITQSKFLHQVRVWPRIPLKDGPTQKQSASKKEVAIDIDLLAKLKYLHTLHVSEESDLKVVKDLFAIKPFPFTSLHSLSLTRMTPAVARAIPVLMELRRLALVNMIGEGLTKEEWKSVAQKMPRLLYLDLPSTVNIMDEKQQGVIEFIRGCGESLRVIECCGVYQKDALEVLLAEPITNTALEMLVDCSTTTSKPKGKGPHAYFAPLTLPVPLNDDVVMQMIRLPAISRFTQQHTALTSIRVLSSIGDRLKELTLANQSILGPLSIEFRSVFPLLTVLETLSISNLKSGGDDTFAARGKGTIAPEPTSIVLDEERYCMLLIAIRTLPALKKLTLDRVPMLSRHLDLLVGIYSNGNKLQEAKYTIAESDRLGLVHLEELHLLSLNSFLHATALNPNPLVVPLDPDINRNSDEFAEQAMIGFERLRNHAVLNKSCVLVMRGIMGLSAAVRTQLKEHFYRGKLQ